MKKLIVFLLLSFLYNSYCSAQPAASAWNGVCVSIKDYMKNNANDPGSIEYVECSNILKFNTGIYGQRVKYRGKNSFGGMVLNEHIFVIKGEGYKAKVTGVLTMDDFKLAASTGKVKIVAQYDSSGKLVN